MSARLLASAALVGLALCTASFADPAMPSTADSSQSDQGSYEASLADLKSGHTNIDYRAFRESYTRSTKYDPYGHPPAEKDMLQAMKAGDCQKVVSSANDVLDADFTDIQAHISSRSARRSWAMLRPQISTAPSRQGSFDRSRIQATERTRNRRSS